MITINQVWRYLRGHALSAAALAELLDRPQTDVVEALKVLSKAKIVKNEKGVWSLVQDIRPTDLRDTLLLTTIKSSDPLSREELTAMIPGSTSAQVYTSLRRLVLQGRVEKVHNGSRTPLYAVAQAA